MGLIRRSFIKMGAAAAGVGAVGSGLTTNMWGLTPDVVTDPDTDGERVVPTFCEICFWKCGVLAHVKGGRVTKIEGNPDHPLSNGRLCPRGTGGTGLLYDPDRLRQPLMRRSKRGQDVFEPVSWTAALDHTAEKLDQIRRRHGPEALALFYHGCGASFFKTLATGYGTANVTAPSYAQCRGSREVGFELTYGLPVGSPEVLDLEHSRVVTFIGAHLGENMHNTQVQDFAKAIDRGAELIVVDPRFSTAAGKAQHWLPIKPGTDLALLLAWMHVILKENLHNADYLNRYATGLDELKAHVRPFTPEWAFVQTGIEPETIAKTARIMAGAAPASLVHPGRRTAWYGDDTQRSRAIAILNALLGSWGHRGGFYIPDQLALAPVPHGPPKREAAEGRPGAQSGECVTLPAGCEAPEPKPPADMPKGVVHPFANNTLAHGIRDASLPGTAEYDIKAWLVYGTNLIQALPQPEKTRAALQALDFVVAVDVLPAEICGWADVVLPECTYLERYDTLQNPPFRQGFVSLRQPVVPPMYQSKPGWWIAKEIGQRLGLAEHFPWEDPEEVLHAQLDGTSISLDELKARGAVRKPAGPTTIEDGLEPLFPTPSGKIELWSPRLAEVGLDPLPKYTPPEEPGPGEMRLLFGRAPNHTFGRTTNNRFLGQLMAENEVWVNVERGRELGLAHGDQVVLENRDGVKAGPVRVKLTQRIRPDCVYMVHGFGHGAKGLRFARGRGADDNALMSRVKIDPVMGTTGMNVTFVTLSKASALAGSSAAASAEKA